jgi:hypothetical protein
LFSGRFKSRADYLWWCHVTDTVVGLQHLGHVVSDGQVSKASVESDKHNILHKWKNIVCEVLVLGQGLLLLVAFGLLAYPIYKMLVGSHP